MNDYIELLQDVGMHINSQSQDKIFQESGNIQSTKDEVVNRFQPIFSPGNIEYLSAKNYLAFLQFENNKHWTGLCRTGTKLTMQPFQN